MKMARARYKVCFGTQRFYSVRPKQKKRRTKRLREEVGTKGLRRVEDRVDADALGSSVVRARGCACGHLPGLAKDWLNYLTQGDVYGRVTDFKRSPCAQTTPIQVTPTPSKPLP